MYGTSISRSWDDLFPEVLWLPGIRLQYMPHGHLDLWKRFSAKFSLQNPEVDESGEKTPCTDQVAKACFHHLEMTTLPVIGVIRKYVRNLLTSKYFIGMITIPSIWNLYEGQGLHGTRFRCFLIQFQVWAQVTLKKIRKQTAANNLLSGKKGRKTTTCLKVMLTFKEVSELSSFNPELPQLYNQSIVGSDVNVTIFNTSEVGSSRSIFVVCAFFCFGKPHYSLNLRMKP